jgi:hypothetical protein
MAKQGSKAAKPTAVPAASRTISDTAEALGLNLLEYRLFSQVFDSVWTHPETSQDRKLHIMATTMALVQGIKPTDDVERMLAAQMVATHTGAMECLRRAAVEGQTFAGRDLNLKHAAKFLTIYARQVEALDKHRGKGQQKVTVEHVQIESGAQAVVGNVRTGDKVTPQISDSEDRAKVITSAPGTLLDPPAKMAMRAEHRRKRSD